MANVRPSSPPPELRTTRGGAPPLERGTCCLPAFTPIPSRFLLPFSLRGSAARDTPARDGRAGPQAGQLGAERGSHPPRYTPSYRAPRDVSPVAGPPDLPWPPVASPQPQHRRAPHTSWGYVFAPCRGPDSHRVSHAQPSGFGPEDPFRVAQPIPGSPQVCGVRSSRRLCPDAPRLVPRQPGFPPARGSPGRGGRWRPPVLTSGPGANREVSHS